MDKKDELLNDKKSGPEAESKKEPEEVKPEDAEKIVGGMRYQ